MIKKQKIENRDNYYNYNVKKYKEYFMLLIYDI